MPAHLKSFMRNSDCVQKKNIVPFLTFEKRVVTNFISDQLFEDHIIPSISISAFCIDFNHL
jgi:hypothetical protein